MCCRSPRDSQRKRSHTAISPLHLLELRPALSQQHDMLVQLLPLVRFEEYFEDCEAAGFRASDVFSKPVLFFHVEKRFKSL